MIKRYVMRDTFAMMSNCQEFLSENVHTVNELYPKMYIFLPKSISCEGPLIKIIEHTCRKCTYCIMYMQICRYILFYNMCLIKHIYFDICQDTYRTKSNFSFSAHLPGKADKRFFTSSEEERF